MLYSAAVICIGASCGALLRWLTALALNHHFPAIPLGTLLVNLIGGFLIGFALSFFAHHPAIAPQWRLMVVTGFLGGLTTFSTFSAEVADLLRRGEFLWAGLHTASHVGGSLAATFLGIASFSLLKRYL